MPDEEIEWMEFDPANDPRVQEVKEPQHSVHEGEGCLGHVVFGIVFLVLGLLALFFMSGI